MNLDNLKFWLLHSATQEKGNNFVLRQSLCIVARDDITDIKQAAGSVRPFAKNDDEDTTTTADHFLLEFNETDMSCFCKSELLLFWETCRLDIVKH